MTRTPVDISAFQGAGAWTLERRDREAREREAALQAIMQQMPQPVPVPQPPMADPFAGDMGQLSSVPGFDPGVGRAIQEEQQRAQNLNQTAIQQQWQTGQDAIRAGGLNPEWEAEADALYQRGQEQGRAALPPDTPGDMFHGITPFDASNVGQFMSEADIQRAMTGMGDRDRRLAALEAGRGEENAARVQAWEDFQPANPEIAQMVRENLAGNDTGPFNPRGITAAEGDLAFRERRQSRLAAVLNNDMGNLTQDQRNNILDRRQDLAGRRENRRRRDLNPNLRAQEVMDEENKRQTKAFAKELKARQQGLLTNAVATLLASMPPEATAKQRTDAVSSLVGALRDSVGQQGDEPPKNEDGITVTVDDLAELPPDADINTTIERAMAISDPAEAARFLVTHGVDANAMRIWKRDLTSWKKHPLDTIKRANRGVPLGPLGPLAAIFGEDATDKEVRKSREVFADSIIQAMQGAP